MMTTPYFLPIGKLSVCSIAFILGAIIGGMIVMHLVVRIPHTTGILLDSFVHAGLLVLLYAKRSVK